jgi:hypothetical protein
VLTESCVLKARAFGDEAAGGPISRAVFVVVPAPPPGPDVHLSDLPLLSGTVGWGGRPRADRTIMDRPLTILGTRYERGMGVHADSELIYALAPEYARFVAVAGVDDEVQEPDATSLAFQVFADDELLFESEVMGAGDPYVSISVELPKGAERLRLVVTDGGDGSHWDHADWASAGFVLRQ